MEINANALRDENWLKHYDRERQKDKNRGFHQLLKPTKTQVTI